MGLLEGPDYYTNRFICYLKQHSIDHYIANAQIPETYNSHELDEFASRDNVVMFAFNNVGLLLRDSNNDNFWKAHNIPVFDYIVDHPRYFSHSMLDPACDLYVFTLDKNHMDYIQKYYPKVKCAFFSPNGGTEINSRVDYYDRTIDVIYMGDCNSPYDSFPCIEAFPDNGKDFYNKTIEYMCSNPMEPTEAAIEWYAANNHMVFDRNLLLQLNTLCAKSIEQHVRRHFKLEGIKALDKAGVHVDIYGNAWMDKNYPFTDNITIHNRVKRDRLMNIIGQARISLCFIPWFKKGCSEKNFDSMLNGALCVTDKSEYLYENYKDGYNIVFFDLNNPDQMAADIKWLLDNPQEASIIARRGYETAKKHDDWDCRFDFVLQKMIQNITP